MDTMDWYTVQVGATKQCKCGECGSVLEANEKNICGSCRSEVINNRGVIRMEDFSTRKSYGRY